MNKLINLVTWLKNLVNLVTWLKNWYVNIPKLPSYQLSPKLPTKPCYQVSSKWKAMRELMFSCWTIGLYRSSVVSFPRATLQIVAYARSSISEFQHPDHGLFIAGNASELELNDRTAAQWHQAVQRKCEQVSLTPLTLEEARDCSGLLSLPLSALMLKQLIIGLLVRLNKQLTTSKTGHLC